MSYLKSSNLRSGMKPYEIYSNCPLVPIFMTDEGLMLMPNFLEVTNDGDCGSKVYGYIEVHLEDLRRITSATDFWSYCTFPSPGGCTLSPVPFPHSENNVPSPHGEKVQHIGTSKLVVYFPPSSQNFIPCLHF